MTDDERDAARNLAADLVELLEGVDGVVAVSAMAKLVASYHVMLQPADKLQVTVNLFHMLLDAEVRELSEAYERDKQ